MNYRTLSLSLILLAGLTLSAQPALAQRDAAFVQPGGGGAGHKEGDEVISPSPKTLDVGDTAIGVTKRVTLFFTNYSGREATIGSLSINADSNVRTEAVQNDCAALGKLKANDKCTVIIEITPNSPGKWSAEIVAVHDQAGRVSRATISGATSGNTNNDGQLPGLSLVGAAKDQQIDFGDVPSGNHAVRTVLLANDSPNPLKIERIMLMAADKGLSLLDKDGCSEDMNVPAGSSCPVTVLWEPGNDAGEVSTDLIIRHTGPIGFAVIPVRGKSGVANANSGGGNNAGSEKTVRSAVSATAMPPSPSDIPALAADALFTRAAGDDAGAKKKTVKGGVVPDGTAAGPLVSGTILRGTAGDQALIATNEGTVALVSSGQSFVSGGVTYRVVSVNPTSVQIEADGNKETLTLARPVMTVTGESKTKLSGGPSSSAGASPASTTSKTSSGDSSSPFSSGSFGSSSAAAKAKKANGTLQ